jgi:hypothetical protein
LDFIRAYPDRTQSEIDQIAGNTRRVLGKRFNELEAVGMIEGKFKRRCTVTGSMARIYRVCAMKPGADIVQRDLFEGKGD